MDEATSRRRGDPTQSLSRAIDILEAVADGPASLPQLVERLGLPRATVHRLAVALVERGLLESSGRSGYRIGRRLHELGSAYDT